MQQVFLGLEVKLTLTNKETVCGTIYAYDATSETLVLKEATDPILPKRSTEESFRVISSRFIENVEGVKLPSERPVPEAIDLDDVMAREEIELDKASRDSERLMAGATHKGQLLYNYLSKIYNTECSWGSNHSIVIMRAVTISEPYELENVSGPASNVERIRNQMKKHYASMKK